MGTAMSAESLRAFCAAVEEGSSSGRTSADFLRDVKNLAQQVVQASAQEQVWPGSVDASASSIV